MCCLIYTSTFAIGPAAGDPIPLKNDPLATLTALISSTEGVLAKQRLLKEELESYLKLHDAYLKRWKIVLSY